MGAAVIGASFAVALLACAPRAARAPSPRSAPAASGAGRPHEPAPTTAEEVQRADPHTGSPPRSGSATPPLAPQVGHANEITAVDVAPTGGLVASGDLDGRVVV